MKKLFLSTFLLISFIGYSQKKKFILSGDFANDYNGRIVLQLDERELKADVEHGKFILNGKIDAPVIGTIKFENAMCANEILIDTGNLIAEMKMQLLTAAIPPCITGVNIKGGSEVYEAHAMLIKGLPDLKRKIKNAAEYEKTVTGLYSDYLRRYPDFLFLSQSLYRESYLLSAASLEPLVAQFSAGQKKSKYFEPLKSVINQKKVTAIGSVLPEFEQRSLQNKKVNISSFKGKTVLVDFWASWCGPCRRENPNVVKMYDRYHSKGLEIVGISLDDNYDNWRTAVEADKLNWTQLSDLSGWQNAVAKKFYVSSIPFNILIDTEGKVIATNLTGATLEAKLRTLFGE
jgi:thiol-disulfide isomerase/thioredoxin